MAGVTTIPRRSAIGLCFCGNAEEWENDARMLDVTKLSSLHADLSNWALVAPPKSCPVAELAFCTPKAFKGSPADVGKWFWDFILAKDTTMPNGKPVIGEVSGRVCMRFHVTDRTPTCGYVDDAAAAFFDCSDEVGDSGAGASKDGGEWTTMILLSRSRVGRRDFDANQERLKTWMADFEDKEVFRDDGVRDVGEVKLGES